MKKPQRVEDYLEHIADQGIDDAAALEHDHKIQDAVIRCSPTLQVPLK